MRRFEMDVINHYTKQILDKDCGEIPNVENSIHTIQHGYNHTTVNGFDSLVTYTCNYGYEFPDLHTTKSIRCTNNNTWSLVLNPCQLKKCPEPSPLANSFINGSLYVYNHTVDYFCRSGYKFVTGATFYTVLCQVTKQWSIFPPPCKKIQCESPPVVENTVIPAVLTSHVFLYNDSLTYTCILNSDLPDNTTTYTIHCTEDGTWNETPPACELYACSTPPTVTGATAVTTSSDSVLYTCQDNHLFSDGTSQQNATCDTTFHWIPINDTCKIPDHLITTEGYFCGSQIGIRKIADNVINTSARSIMDCALKCVSDVACLSYNFHRGHDNTCELLLQPLSGVSEVMEEDWYGFNVAYRTSCETN